MAEKKFIPDLNLAKEQRVKLNIKKNSLISYTPVPKKLNEQYKLADELVTWVYDNDVVDLDLFPISKRFSPFRFYSLAKYNPYLEEAIEVAQYVMSTRLKAGWRTREMDASYAKDMLPEYNAAYRDWVNSKITAAIQARVQQQQGPTTITVIKQTIPTTPEVPERKIDEDKLRDPSQAE